MTAEHPDVERGSMFGMPILRAGRKAFASWYDGALVLKLGEPDLTAALELPGATPFDPMGGRPMREWVVVPAEHEARWAGLTAAALAYVS